MHIAYPPTRLKSISLPISVDLNKYERFSMLYNYPYFDASYGHQILPIALFYTEVMTYERYNLLIVT